jgi:predicted O-methyltransferase YrrM
MNDYHFSEDWFSPAIPIWTNLLSQLKPSKILEIGSFEGRSTCFLIDSVSKEREIELHCIDTWSGAVEHQIGGFAQTNMSDVEKRFLHNVNTSICNSPKSIDLKIHKGTSDTELSNLLSAGMNNYFDFIYVDGSHQAPDVLTDAVLSFKLSRIGSLIVFDDYLWSEPLPGGKDVLRSPKIAIDAFTNIFARKIQIINAHLDQLYVQKISD